MQLSDADVKQLQDELTQLRRENAELREKLHEVMPGFDVSEWMLPRGRSTPRFAAAAADHARCRPSSDLSTMAAGPLLAARAAAAPLRLPLAARAPSAGSCLRHMCA